MRLQKNSKTRPTIEAATMTDLKQKYDASTVAVMRQALNEVVTGRRFLVRRSVTPLEVAEHILQQAASGATRIAFDPRQPGCSAARRHGRTRRFDTCPCRKLNLAGN
jgi:hypothetical protein